MFYHEYCPSLSIRANSLALRGWEQRRRGGRAPRTRCWDGAALAHETLTTINDVRWQAPRRPNTLSERAEGGWRGEVRHATGERMGGQGALGDKPYRGWWVEVKGVCRPAHLWEGERKAGRGRTSPSALRGGNMRTGLTAGFDREPTRTRSVGARDGLTSLTLSCAARVHVPKPCGATPATFAPRGAAREDVGRRAALQIALHEAARPPGRSRAASASA